MHFLLSLVTAGLVSADVFSINAFIPGSSIDGSLLHASHHGLYSGLTEPATYCPLNPPSDCPQVAGTLVTQNMGAMAVRTHALMHQVPLLSRSKLATPSLSIVSSFCSILAPIAYLIHLAGVYNINQQQLISVTLSGRK